MDWQLPARRNQNFERQLLTMPRYMMHGFMKFAALAGALALPLASMANDATGFPTVPAATGADSLWQDGPDATLFLAQSTGGTGGSSGGGSDHGSISDRSPAYPAYSAGAAPDASGITPSATSSIAALLTTGGDYCRALGNPAYTVDCLSYQYWVTAQSMPRTGGYADARKALLAASEKLHALAMANRDRSKPAARGNVGGKKTSRPLIPVTNVAAVNAQAETIVQDTKLVLLRSSRGSDQRRLAYEQIAAVVNSNKVLLRSG
jgi:hypothetical protein